MKTLIVATFPADEGLDGSGIGGVPSGHRASGVGGVGPPRRKRPAKDP
jgi:hypothetical protein